MAITWWFTSLTTVTIPGSRLAMQSEMANISNSLGAERGDLKSRFSSLLALVFHIKNFAAKG